MTQSPQQPDRLGSLSRELALGIAQDLENITDRIAEMKVLCDQQMDELADAAAAAAGITQVLAGRQVAAPTDAGFAGLKAELSNLYETVGAQAELHKDISKEFLEVARHIAAEIGTLRDAGVSPLGSSPGHEAGSPAATSVVWLSGWREAREDAVAEVAAKELRRALQTLQESAVALFRTQTQSREMVASLRQRMHDYLQRTRNA